MKQSTIIIIAVIVLVLAYFGFTYNHLVTARTAADAQWAQVEAQYQRRFDLIPNLVNAVKGSMKQEQAVFGAIADARTHYANAKGVDDKAQAASEVESSFARLLVVMENYPALKSSENVMALQSQIEGTENRISVERGRFNEAVGSYNLAVSRFPSALVASTFGFQPRAYFKAAAGTEVAPTVNL
ncbi:MAG TPA: LemA family protein [Candidatus Paceibacterota bacterium]|nr:LemA family protein [Candidatus Paceibacterota bacterium]